MKLTLASALAFFAGALSFLEKHDTTGVLANPTASLADKAKAIEPAIAQAGATIVEQGVLNAVGPEGAGVAEAALPILDSIAAAVEAQRARITSTPATA